MDVTDALRAAAHLTEHTLPELDAAVAVLELAGHAAEAQAVEDYLIDQSDEAWEACGVTPY